MITIEKKSLAGYSFIDLFAGLGGFRIALESLGAKCVYSNEWNVPVQKVYADNFGDIPEGDITQVDENTIPDHDILCAGFPCQAFSISGKQRGFEDSRGTLFFDVARIVKAKKPKVVFMENVKNFATHDHGKTLEVVKRTMETLGYTFYQKVLNAVDYGIPQKRERIYMVCFRNDLGITGFSYPKPFKLTGMWKIFFLMMKKWSKICMWKDLILISMGLRTINTVISRSDWALLIKVDREKEFTAQRESRSHSLHPVAAFLPRRVDI